MDNTQWSAMYALLEGITKSAEAEDAEACGRLAGACKAVMTGLPIEDEPTQKT